MYSRSTLHPEGAHSLEAELHNVAALRGELMAPALEALLIVDNDLFGRQRQAIQRLIWTQNNIISHKFTAVNFACLFNH